MTDTQHIKIPLSTPPPDATSVLLFFDLVRTRVLEQSIVVSRQDVDEEADKPGFVPLHRNVGDDRQQVEVRAGDLAYEVRRAGKGGRESLLSDEPESRAEPVFLYVKYEGAKPRLHPDSGHVWLIGDRATDGRTRQQLESDNEVSFAHAMQLRRGVIQGLRQRASLANNRWPECATLADAMEFFANLDEATSPFSQATTCLKLPISNVTNYLVNRGIERSQRSGSGPHGFVSHSSHQEARDVAKCFRDQIGDPRPELGEYFALFVAGELDPRLYEYSLVGDRPAYVDRIVDAGRPDSSSFFCFAEACFWLASVLPGEKEHWQQLAPTMVWAADAFASLYHGPGLRRPETYTNAALHSTAEGRAARAARLDLVRGRRDRFIATYAKDSQSAVDNAAAIEDAFSVVMLSAYRDARPGS